jgi:hypothetical protein
VVDVRIEMPLTEAQRLPVETTITPSAPFLDPRDLIQEVTSRIPLPLDVWEITALLESLGITDDLASQRYEFADVFALADYVLTATMAQIKPALRENSGSSSETPTPLRKPAQAVQDAGRIRWLELARASVRIGSMALVAAMAALVIQLLPPRIGPFASEPVNDEVSLPMQAPPASEPAEDKVAQPVMVEAVPTATSAPTPVQPPPRVLLDERFVDNRRGWPDNSGATAWLTGEGYRLAARWPGQFVAVGARLANPVWDVTVTVSFRKVGGPPGGGYGVILGDQGPGPRDGLYQGGRYYVLEVGDRAELGIWRYDNDHWVDLIPWVKSSRVHPGSEPNEVQARVDGTRLVLVVNGTQVASIEDGGMVLPVGDVGVFVGGDGNDVLLEHLVVQVPAE